MRRYIREKIGNAFFEVYVKSTIDTCISRDPKGLYKKAIDGQINNFTGISAPFEEPQNPDLILDTEKYDLADSVEMLIDSIKPIISI
jgi:adenylylsulfate kinase